MRTLLGTNVELPGIRDLLATIRSESSSGSKKSSWSSLGGRQDNGGRPILPLPLPLPLPRTLPLPLPVGKMGMFFFLRSLACWNQILITWWIKQVAQDWKQIAVKLYLPLETASVLLIGLRCHLLQRIPCSGGCHMRTRFKQADYVTWKNCLRWFLWNSENFVFLWPGLYGSFGAISSISSSSS